MHERILSFLLWVFLFTACTGQQRVQEPAVKLEESFSLAQQDSVLFRHGAAQFWLKVEQIQDSRCPKDVNCITGGKASVLVKLEEGSAASPFCIGADCRPTAKETNSTTVEENNKRYIIVLEAVSPYPQTGNEAEQKRAIFKIKQATS